jgi:hypothetical protein
MEGLPSGNQRALPKGTSGIASFDRQQLNPTWVYHGFMGLSWFFMVFDSSTRN